MADGGEGTVLASAAGLEQIQPQNRNVLRASTFRVGQLIIEALNKQARHIILGLGGSATNDGGAGMLAALGIQPVQRPHHVTGSHATGIVPASGSQSGYHAGFYG